MALKDLPIDQLAQAVKKQRLKLHLTQKQYAKKLGISKSTLGRIEKGESYYFQTHFQPIAGRDIREFSKKTQEILSNANPKFSKIISRQTNVFSLMRPGNIKNIFREAKYISGKSTKELAKKFGVTPGTIYRWQNGHFTDINKVRHKKEIQDFISKNKWDSQQRVQGFVRDKRTGKVIPMKARSFEGLSEELEEFETQYRDRFLLVGIRKLVM